MNKIDGISEQPDFLSDKKESIGLVIYQISQLDKSVTQLTERMDTIANRMEMRVQAIELWKAGFNQKIATQEQLDTIKEEMKAQKNIVNIVGVSVLLTIIGAILKLVLKV